MRDTDAVGALLVEVAERVILPRFRLLAAHEVDEKKPGDLVTIADREAEVAIAEALRAADPRALIVGEEAAFADPGVVDGLPGAGHAWVIDPVDGTRNFASGSPDFGVMLAEVRAGEAVRAWIWQPVREVMFVVERGAGATRNGVRLPPLAPRTPPWRAAVPRRLRGDDDPRFRFTWTRGACAVDYPRLAAGEVDALGYTTQHPWDHLPGTLLIRELGGLDRLEGAETAWRPGARGRHLFVTADAALMEALQTRAAR